MTQQPTSILSPVGRMIQGHPFDKITTNMKGGPLTDKQGNPREEYFFSVAFPKTDPLILQIWQQLQQVAQAGFPGGQSQWPTFSWKVSDGDQPPNNAKEGFPGNYVFKFKSGFSPKVFTKGGAQQIVEKDALKRGYYVRVYFNVAANGDLQKPGLFLNPNIVELVAYGEEIVSGPDGTVFAEAPVGALPAGASATPVAGGPPIATGLPGGPPPVGGPPTMGPPPVGGPPTMGPPPVGGPPTMGPPPVGGPPALAGIAPAPDFLNPPPAAPLVPVRSMTAKAAGVSYDAFRKQGWTDDALVSNGYMLP